jgi:transposase
MRYELTDGEWAAIKPFLPNKPRGVPRVNDRRVLNGIFWVLRSGAPWRDLPEDFGPYTTCYNRFVRWRRAGVWDQLMNALTAGYDAAVRSNRLRRLLLRRHRYGCLGSFGDTSDKDFEKASPESGELRWRNILHCRICGSPRRER